MMFSVSPSTKGEPIMDKEIRFKVSDAQMSAIEIIANRKGLTLGAFVRMAALDEAARNGIHAEQPKAE
jgi:uncharacterized protein (DUF1778 family)